MAKAKVKVKSELIIKSPDGKNTITLLADNNTVGIWLNREDSKAYLGLVFDSSSKTPYIAISTNQDGPPQLAITVGDDGKLLVQDAYDPDNVKFSDLGEK